MAIFGNKDKNGNFTINFCSVKDTPIYDLVNFAISATLLDDKIKFQQRLGKKNKVYLEYSKILGMQIVDTEKVIEKNKSVAKRATVGGVLLGPIGAIIGGLDGTGTKRQNIYKKYLVFNYISNGEEKEFSVEIVGATLGLNKFIEQLKIKCPNLAKANNLETYL